MENAKLDPIYNYTMNDANTPEEKALYVYQLINAFKIHIEKSFQFVAEKTLTTNCLNDIYIKTDLIFEEGLIIVSIYSKKKRAIVKKKFELFNLIKRNDNGTMQKTISKSLKEMLTSIKASKKYDSPTIIGEL